MFCYMFCCVVFVICFVICFVVCFVVRFLLYVFCVCFCYIFCYMFFFYVLLYRFLVLIKSLSKYKSGVVTILVHVFPLPPCPTLLFPGGAGAGINIFCDVFCCQRVGHLFARAVTKKNAEK